MLKIEQRDDIERLFAMAKTAGVTFRVYEANGRLGLVAEGNPMHPTLRCAFAKHQAAAATVLWRQQKEAEAELAIERAKFVLAAIAARGLDIRFSKHPDGWINWSVSGDMGDEASEICRLYHQQLSPVMFSLKVGEDATR